jgi:hypothetical protein
MFPSFVPAILGSHMLIAAVAGGVPNIDLQKVCHDSESAMVGLGDNPTSSFDSCMSDEQAAREQLLKDWASYSASDKSHCIHPADYLPSYVEWLTCVEMEGNVRQIRQGRSVITGPGSATSGRD